MVNSACVHNHFKLCNKAEDEASNLQTVAHYREGTPVLPVEELLLWVHRQQSQQQQHLLMSWWSRVHAASYPVVNCNECAGIAKIISQSGCSWGCNTAAEIMNCFPAASKLPPLRFNGAAAATCSSGVFSCPIKLCRANLASLITANQRHARDV